MWTIWQDSPEYGCDDNPSYKWYAKYSMYGHITKTAGPFNTQEEVEDFVS